MKDRYEEALALARQGKSIEEIFHELRESEDERIRKFLVKHVSEWIGCIEHDLKLSSKDVESEEELAMFKAGLAYLEKQKEQKPEQYDIDVLEKHITKDSISELAHTVIVRNGWEIVEKEQKPDDDPLNDPKFIKGFDTGREVQRIFDEQKPAEKQDYSGLNDLERAILRGFLAAGVENVPVTIIKETAKECLSQINPAEWSEEDEKEMKKLISWLGGCVYHSTYAQETAYKQHIARWLKSLRPWKPSEDEERLINISISYLKYYADKGYENAVECIDWLKSKLNGNSGK